MFSKRRNYYRAREKRVKRTSQEVGGGGGWDVDRILGGCSSSSYHTINIYICYNNAANKFNF